MEDEQPKIETKDLMLDENYGMILPDNDRVRDKIRRADEIKKKRQEEELKKKQMADELTNAKNQKLLKDEQERERRRREMESAKLNYEKFADSVEKGEGNLNEIFSTILRNTSAYELAFPNYNMEDGWDFRLLMTILERNTSLLTLSLSRKNLGDVEAKKISEMLSKNKKLRRLELEGNFFGPESAKHFAKALKVNNTLRYLDLENNNLTDKGKDTSGIQELLQAMQSNTMLISLNLSNNYLNADVGGMIVDMFRSNKTIIHFEFFQNKDFCDRPNNEDKKDENSKFMSTGLYINQIEKIKQALKENKEAYDKMRKDEWLERKRMTSNYQDTVDTQIIIDAKHLQEETRKKEKEYIEALYLDNFNAHVKEMEDELNNRINQYWAETKERLSKKKKKRGKKKKK